MSLIGIVGQAGHGKDTIGDILHSKYKFVKCALADPLKEGICKTVFGFTDEQLYTQLGKEKIDDFWYVSPREVMQFVGTDLFREQMGKLLPVAEKEFWLEVFRKKRNDLIKKLGYVPNMVVTDIRFKNEAEFIQRHGGIIWKVQRDVGSHVQFLSDPTRSHISEQEQLEITNIDELIMNNGTIEELEQKIDVLIHKL